MAPQNMPAAEVDVDDDLVRSLLRDQHLDLADLPLVELANGWDNVIYRLGEELTIRLPRRAMAASLVEHEQHVLPGFAERLPIAIPAPVRVGQPGRGYPWAWSINPWFAGTIAATTPFTDPSVEAQRLGEFLAALHTPAAQDAPKNPYRGHFVGDNTEIFTARAAALASTGGFDANHALRRWGELVDVDPFNGAPRWIHGDLHPANVLVDGGEIRAVIDFGDVCAGDPATDLAAAWALFDELADRDLVRSAAGDVDDATWQRAEAWALHFALAYLAHSADNPTMGTIARRLLVNLSI